MYKMFVFLIIFLMSYLILVRPISKEAAGLDNGKKIKALFLLGALIFSIIMALSDANTPIISSTIFIISLKIFWSPLWKKITTPTKVVNSQTINSTTKGTTTVNVVTDIKCPKCGKEYKNGEQFCIDCGTSLKTQALAKSKQVIYADPADYEEDATLTLDEYIKKHINKEIEKAGLDIKDKLIPSQALKRQNILALIFSALLCFYISMIFFHFPIITYLIGLVILIVLFTFTIKLNTEKYIMKQIKARPNEKISNILMNIKSSLVKNTSKNYLLIGCLIAICIPLVYFKNPRIFYEEMDNGYGVRFYTFGLTNFDKATIPSTYKGKKVISLRGNTFSNMPLLTEIFLPDTITEIRGQAFAGLIKLEKITLPKNLEYLGGGAFKNCISLKSIVIPDKIKEINGETFKSAYALTSITLPEGLEKIGGGAFANCESLKEIIIPDSVTYIGGEAFQFDYELSNVKLSKNITEIKGNTFEECTSLKTIKIPDNVTRIGGHAFYASGLTNVILTKDSKLAEIGSSAFRRCYGLTTIRLPKTTIVNERAFKESPTVITHFD